MKTYLLSIFLLVATTGAAQFQSAELQAAGLTCAMCSNAINKSLQTLAFIQKVEVDLNRSSFELTFKENILVDFDAIRRKVEDAGFSVSNLIVQARLNHRVSPSGILEAYGVRLCVIGMVNESFNGLYRLQVTDQGFVSDKKFRQFAKQIKNTSCGSANSTEKKYHVVITEG